MVGERVVEWARVRRRVSFPYPSSEILIQILSPSSSLVQAPAMVIRDPAEVYADVKQTDSPVESRALVVSAMLDTVSHYLSEDVQRQESALEVAPQSPGHGGNERNATRCWHHEKGAAPCTAGIDALDDHNCGMLTRKGFVLVER